MPVVALCGSMRFQRDFARLEQELTLAGNVVLTPAVVDPSHELTADDRERLAALHLQRIAMADEVLVVNVGGYVGDRTRLEVAHARARGIVVRYTEPANEG